MKSLPFSTLVYATITFNVLGIIAVGIECTLVDITKFTAIEQVGRFSVFTALVLVYLFGKMIYQVLEPGSDLAYLEEKNLKDLHVFQYDILVILFILLFASTTPIISDLVYKITPLGYEAQLETLAR